MTKNKYISFCKKYDIDPENYDDVLYTVDELEGMFGDKSGELQEIREYIEDETYGAYVPDITNTPEISKDSGIVANIYQVVEGKTREFGFMPYKYIIEKYGNINLDVYEKVAEVPIPKTLLKSSSDVITVLDYVFSYGNTNQEFYANNPKARSISVSDLIQYGDKYYYVDSIGFMELEDNDFIKGDNKVTEAKDTEPFINDEDVDDNYDDFDPDGDKTLFDYLQDRIGQQLSVAEFNTILQSLFSRFNDIFIIESDIYNADLDETQELTVWDDDDEYIINYDIIDVVKGIIEITDVNVR